MTGRFVCLMYHQVLGAGPSASPDDYFAVSREMFGRHLDAIRAEGLAGLSIGAAVAAMGQSRVAISFDDGTIDHFEHAFPELVRRGMTATFFVTTTWVGGPGYASWDQLRLMRDAGMEIGSHTRTHPFLSELSGDALWAELAQSRAEIEVALARETRLLALPGGDAPRRGAWAKLSDAGYTIVGTSRWGTNDESENEAVRWLRRCTVHGRLSDGEFRAIVRGDAALGWQRRVRETVLAATRSAVGPSRYARLRRRVLRLVERRGGESGTH